MLRLLDQFGQLADIFTKRKRGAMATPYDPIHGEDNLSETQSGSSAPNGSR
jgi:hypothetical protein